VGLQTPPSNPFVIRTGVTNAPGDASGISIIDTTLIGYGIDSFNGMSVIIHPDDDRHVSVSGIVPGGFDTATGEIVVGTAFKGGQVPAWVPYQIVIVDDYTVIAKTDGVFIVIPSNPTVVALGTVQDLSLSITTVDGIPPAADLGPGTITITRVRGGVETVIVNADGCNTADGRIYYDYNFPGADWQTCDEYKAVFSGQQVKVGMGVAHDLSDQRCRGVVAGIGYDGVWVDATLGVAGTTYPIGTPGMPVSNLTDAIVIATARKTRKLHIRGWHGLADNMNNWYFIGTDPSADTIDPDGFTINGSFFEDVELKDGATSATSLSCRRCNLVGADFLDGYLFQCHIVAVASVPALWVRVYDCIVDGEFDFNTNITSHRFTNISGNLILDRVNGAGCIVDIWGNGLSLTINASCTAGTINIYGDVKVTNDAAGTTVNDYSTHTAAMQAWKCVIPNIDVSLAAIDSVLTTSPAAGAPDAGNTIMDLPITAGLMYKLEDLVLKVSGYGGGATKITIQVWELLNGNARGNYINTVTTIVPDDYAITTYLGLTELFGKKPVVVGDGIAITAITDAGNTGALTCTYTYSTARVS
jgi:hypothetical protein